MDWTIDVATVIVLIGIGIAAYYQRRTVEQMKLQTTEMTSTLQQMQEQTSAMQTQTREMREAMANETRPVLFATIVTSGGPKLLIGNHGRNPASDLRIRMNDSVRSRDGDPLNSDPLLNQPYPILPGAYRLKIDLSDNVNFDHFFDSMTDTWKAGQKKASQFPIVEIDVEYRDAITETRYQQKLGAVITTESEGFTLEPLDL